MNKTPQKTAAVSLHEEFKTKQNNIEKGCIGIGRYVVCAFPSAAGLVRAMSRKK
jgi:hypothetical protein